MPFTVAQTRSFFENASQMAIPRDTLGELASEGITSVADLADFDKVSLKQIVENLRRPGGRVPCPPIGQRNGSPAGTTILTPLFVFDRNPRLTWR